MLNNFTNQDYFRKNNICFTMPLSRFFSRIGRRLASTLKHVLLVSIAFKVLEEKETRLVSISQAMHLYE